MTWRHIAALAIGGLLCAGTLLPGGAALLPIGTMVIGGALGHAQANRNGNGNGNGAKP